VDCLGGSFEYSMFLVSRKLVKMWAICDDSRFELSCVSFSSDKV
jgi:hypothetical protein